MVPSYLRSVYRLMYQNPVGRKLIKYPVTTSLLRRATARHGVKMDDPLSAAQIEKFIETYGVNVDEVELSMESYLTFNDFFCRKLKAGVRPIANPDDDTILVAPADCRLLVFPSIEDTTKIWLKGQDFTIASLLGPNFQHMLAHFHNPAIAIARLAPQDYHRWHLPISSTVGPRQSIAGTYFSVSPRAVREVNILCTNKREVCMFDNPLYGKWCMIAVGAAMVSSIIISDDMEEGVHAPKGAEHGWFRFGGSTLILLFDSHTVQWDEDLIEASRKPIETYVKVGTRIGQFRGAAQAVQKYAPSSTGEDWTLVSPQPTSPSIIRTATTDAARKEAHLNDEGLMNDFPYTMQSNLTLVPLEDGDTVPAKGVPKTTKAQSDAAEAVSADVSSRRASVVEQVQELLPSFLQPDDSALARPELERGVSSEPVPAPAVFHLVRFTGDDQDSSGSPMEDDVEQGEADALMDDERDQDVLMEDVEDGAAAAPGKSSRPSNKKKYAQAKHLAVPSASESSSVSPKSSRRRTRADGKSSSSSSEDAVDPEDARPKKKTKTKGSR